MSWAPVYIVGAGRVGGALAAGLARAGVELRGLWTRTAAEAELARAVTGLPCHHGPFPADVAAARTVIVSVLDRHVATVAGALLDAGLLRGAGAVLHCGGAAPAEDALRPLVHTAVDGPGGAGAVVPVGTLHPLMAVASAEQAAARIGRACFAVEGEPRAREAAAWLAGALGARWFVLGARQMALYHAAAVLASNHAVGLWHVAQELLGRLQVPPEALQTLLDSTLDNVREAGLPEALTGPVRRGDAATIQRHLDVLEQLEGELRTIYEGGTLAALRAARGCAGAEPRAADAARIRRIVTRGQR